MKKYVGFDIARVISMIYIIGVFHPLGYVDLFYHNYIVRTLVYVSLCTFTFLSAFLAVSINTFDNKSDIIRYYKKRFLRLYPLFFIAAILMLILGLNGKMSTLLGLIGIAPIIGYSFRTLWYVSMLLFFILLTPLISSRRRYSPFLKCFTTFLLISIFEYFICGSIDTNFNYYFFVYIVGIILGLYYNNYAISFLHKKSNVPITVLLFLIALIIGVFFRNSLFHRFVGVLGFIALINISCAFSSKTYPRLFKLVAICSFASMTAYLFHRIIYYVILKIWNPGGVLELFYIMAVGLPMTIIIAYFIQVAYDKMINKIVKI